MGTEPRSDREGKRRQAFLHRLDQAMQATGVTKADIGRRVQASGGTVYEWWTLGALPSGEKMLLLAEVFPKISMHWLLTGRGPMLTADRDTSQGAVVQGARLALARLEQAIGRERAYWEGTATPAPALADDVALTDHLPPPTPARQRRNA